MTRSSAPRKQTTTQIKGRTSKRLSDAENENVSSAKNTKSTPNAKSASTSTRGKKASSSKSTASNKLEGLFSISLDGDDNESVKIYDTCDEVRRKIRAHLRRTGSTNVAFLRDIARAGWPNAPPSIQSKQLNDFMRKKGGTAGSTSRVFYGAYVYFEKMRTFENKPKSKHRLEMEKRWSREGGFPREQSRWLTLHDSEYAYEDNLGSIVIERR